jgi:hypothetical protein
MAAGYALAGFAAAALPPRPGQLFGSADVANMLVQAFLMFGWCRADAGARGIAPPAGAPLLVAAFALIGIPYYFYRSRPWQQATLAVGKAALFFIGMLLLSMLGTWIGSLLFAAHQSPG